MNKNFFIAAGSLVVASLLFLAFINVFGPEKEPDSIWNLASLVGNQKEKIAEVSQLPAGSFGSLATLSSAVNSEGSMETAPMGFGGVATPNVSQGDKSRVSDLQMPETIALGAGGGGVSSMIMPYNSFKYIYVGDEINQENDSSLVYLRLKNQDTLAKDIAKNLSNFDFAGIKMNSFDNLKVNNLSFTEDKDKGLMINFDLKEGNVYIYENWEKWQIAERDACGANQDCWDKYRLKIEDVPADSELIKMADSFLSNHNIDINNYGEPQVDNNWRTYYDMAVSKADYYIQEQMTVIYPLLIEGSPVRDQSGNYTGLRVTVNLLHNQVSGLSGLMPYRYESSEYDLEKDSERIVALAEDGGWARNYYSQEQENIVKIELGTPELSYVQMYRYQNNKSEELLVPALIFPVINKPEQGYYGGNFISVPLVKELMDELEKDQDNWLMMRGGVTEPGLPMMDISQGASSSSSTEEVEASNGQVEFEIMPVIEPEMMR